jgi:hypothetical protein
MATTTERSEAAAEVAALLFALQRPRIGTAFPALDCLPLPPREPQRGRGSPAWAVRGPRPEERRQHGRPGLVLCPQSTRHTRPTPRILRILLTPARGVV